MGQININPFAVKLPPVTHQQYYYEYSKIFSAILHETVHILGFNPGLFPYFVKQDPVTLQYEYKPENRTIQGNRILGEAIGAHWEKTMFYDELMTAV
jgi:hypothetical protein